MVYIHNKNKLPNNLRVIKTARDEKSINEAARNGYKPLVKRLEPSKSIHSKFSVLQCIKTGEIEVIFDFRMADGSSEETEYITVIDWTYYYPYLFKSPFAAYLIPNDIEVGENVFIEDLIEDIIGSVWNQGDTFRLKSCAAVWNGKDLEIKYDPARDHSIILG